MFERGDIVYIFGRESLKGRVHQLLDDKMCLVEMDKPRWWFGGEDMADGKDMHIRIVYGYVGNLERASRL